MPRRRRQLPDWTYTELVMFGRGYCARVDRTLELLEQIAAGLAQRGPAARQPKGTTKLKERR